MKEAALIGADVATAPPKVIHDMITHPLTQSGLDKFGKDAKEAGIEIV